MSCPIALCALSRFFLFSFCFVDIIDAADTIPEAGEGQLDQIIVEAVDTTGPGDEDGIQTGDVLLFWTRFPNPPSNPKLASGCLATPIDWDVMVLEQAPRGCVEVIGRRDGKRLVFNLHLRDRDLTVRPWLPEYIESLYRQAKEAFASGDLSHTKSMVQEMNVELREQGLFKHVCWVNLRFSRLFGKRHHWPETLEYAEKALSLAEKMSDNVVQAKAWNTIGLAFMLQNRPEEARHAYQNALAIRQRQGEKSLAVADVFNQLGLLAHKQSDFTAAETHHRIALEIRNILAPDSLAVAGSLNNLANIASDRGDLSASEKLQRRSLAIKEKLDPASSNLASSFNNLAALIYQKGDLKGAESLFRKALEIHQKRDPESLSCANSLNNVAIMAHTSGDFQTAQEDYRAALVIREKLLPDSMEVAASYNNLGMLALDSGKLKEAENWMAKSLALREKWAPKSLDLAGSFDNMALLLQDRGDFSRGETYLRKALEIREELAPSGLEVAVSMNNLGTLCRIRGDLESAEYYQKKALEIRRAKSPKSLDEAGSLYNLGVIAKERGDDTRAEHYATQSLAILEKLTPNSKKMLMPLHQLGLIFAKKQDYAEAKNKFSMALAIAEKTAPEGLEEALITYSMGKLAFHMDSVDECRRLFLHALSIQQRLAPNTMDTANTLYGLAQVSIRNENFTQALDYLKHTVATLDVQRGRLGGGQEVSGHYSARFADYYRDLVSLHLKFGQDMEAFDVLERFRARALLSMLAERDMDFSADAPEELICEQTLINTRYDRIQQLLGVITPGKDPQKTQEIREEFQALREKQRALTRNIKHASPKFAQLKYPEPLNMTQVKTAFDPGTLFLSYCIGNTSCYLFALLEGELAVFTLPCQRSELEGAVSFYRALLCSPETDELLLSKKAWALFDVLLGPAEVMIEKSKSLLICPDGALHALPFAALRCGDGAFFIERKPISYTLSANIHATHRGMKKTSPDMDRLIAFADPNYGSFDGSDNNNAVTRTFDRNRSFPPLPATRQEVETISQLFLGSTRICLAEEATEETARSIGTEFTHIHFACHGYFDHRFPLNSGLVLSVPQTGEEGRENGFFQAWEVFESLRINAALVTLSGCQTALGQEMGGEGLIGLTRAFLYSGAQSVLSSLWQVADEATSDFMQRFYGYLKQGVCIKEALQRTQIDFIRSDGNSAVPGSSDLPWKHPFFWAAFVLNGNQEVEAK